jgi:hypothetical protein
MQRQERRIRPPMTVLKFTPEADVAQLVEQSIRNRQVIGSSPIVGSIYSCRCAPHRR